MFGYGLVRYSELVRGTLPAVLDKTSDPIATPLDSSNRRLLDLVRPRDWRTSNYEDYDLVVIGGGTAGLVTSIGAAGLGARVLLLEKRLLGGDCLNVGCVPSKSLLRSARVVREVREALAGGRSVSDAVLDFATAMQRMREVRADIAQNDSAERLATAGVHVLFGTARFVDRKHICIQEKRIRFHRAVIATGGRPVTPSIPGLRDAGYLTNESIFSLTELPPRLLVIGAGSIGCELAQVFSIFGSKVTVADLAGRPLAQEDPDAAAIMQRRLSQDGVHFELGVQIKKIHRSGSEAVASWSRGAEHGEIKTNEILVATGRAPNIEDLGLVAAGVDSDSHGVLVNEELQTTNSRIYAAGDVALRWKFTHAADASARLLLQNAFFFGRRRVSRLVIPWCTYTIPEVAHVGTTYKEALEQGASIITIPFKDIDRAVIDGDTDGFVRVSHQKGRMMGCTIVGDHAGDLIAHAATVLRMKGTVSDLAGAIMPYPTRSEALRKVGDSYRRTLLTPRRKRWLSRYFEARRWF